MTMMIPRDLRLPEDCRVRLVDLPVQAGGMIAVGEDGFVNIYLNARLSREAQMEALRHELRHHYRGDLYSDADIRTVEREADGPCIRDIEGRPLAGATSGFEPGDLRRVGQGLYLPTGRSLEMAARHVEGLRGLLLEACRIYDVMQLPPLTPAADMLALAGTLKPEDIAFVAWQPMGERRVAVLHFSREDLYGAIYYAPDGAPDNAMAVMRLGDVRVVVDVRRRGGRPEVCGITREIGDSCQKIY